MQEVWLRKPGGEFLAVIRTDSTGMQRIYRPGGDYLGRYDPGSNITFRVGGELFGYGNLLTALTA